MPHVSIKHWPTTFTESQRDELVSELTRTVTRVFGVEEGSVSIAVEAVEPSRWMDEVHTPEIAGRAHLLWKQPHYSAPIPTQAP
ncbi:tautomerase family protein [Streptomyces sp. NRRL F-5126]|uniref:tautomerase family protein n=1 Tax=Streptomyces sp. NRRL F-5126 TaxID=1463857 RepID=UPI0004CB5013|nr:tautomerase family protein [Streptomyces sp. NRRL F-5126]